MVMMRRGIIARLPPLLMQFRKRWHLRRSSVLQSIAMKLLVNLCCIFSIVLHDLTQQSTTRNWWWSSFSSEGNSILPIFSVGSRLFLCWCLVHVSSGGDHFISWIVYLWLLHYSFFILILCSRSILSKCTFKRLAEKSKKDSQIRLVWPGGKDSVTITNGDMDRLKQGEFLNDVIINFYLKYIYKDIFDPPLQDRSHIFR